MILLGPPASGKGTQGQRFAADHQLSYLSTGAVLRDHVSRDTEVGKLAGPILARGEYLPDELMCRLIEPWLNELQGGWVLDGFPRSVYQSKWLDRWLEANQIQLSAAIALIVPYEVLHERMLHRVECSACRWTGPREALVASAGSCPKCGGAVATRLDDTDENFLRRYREFECSAIPVIEYYRQSSRLCEIDANAPEEQVFQTFRSLIETNI